MAFSAFNSHVYRHHRAALGMCVEQLVTSEASSQPEPDVYADDLYDSSATAELLAPGSVSDVMYRSGYDHCDSSEETSCSITDEAARFLLQLREGCQLSQAAILDVITGCKILCSGVADRYKASITAALASAGISSDAIPSLSVALEESPSPFHGIDSNYLFEKYCVDNFWMPGKCCFSVHVRPL